MNPSPPTEPNPFEERLSLSSELGGSVQEAEIVRILSDPSITMDTIEKEGDLDMLKTDLFAFYKILSDFYNQSDVITQGVLRKLQYAMNFLCSILPLHSNLGKALLDGEIGDYDEVARLIVENRNGPKWVSGFYKAIQEFSTPHGEDLLLDVIGNPNPDYRLLVDSSLMLAERHSVKFQNTLLFRPVFPTDTPESMKLYDHTNHQSVSLNNVNSADIPSILRDTKDIIAKFKIYIARHADSSSITDIAARELCQQLILFDEFFQEYLFFGSILKAKMEEFGITNISNAAAEISDVLSSPIGKAHMRVGQILENTRRIQEYEGGENYFKFSVLLGTTVDEGVDVVASQIQIVRDFVVDAVADTRRVRESEALIKGILAKTTNPQPERQSKPAPEEEVEAGNPSDEK